eukprot:15450628-Alexandrium_andersonii.AAC.1
MRSAPLSSLRLRPFFPASGLPSSVVTWMRPGVCGQRPLSVASFERLPSLLRTGGPSPGRGALRLVRDAPAPRLLGSEAVAPSPAALSRLRAPAGLGTLRAWSVPRRLPLRPGLSGVWCSPTPLATTWTPRGLLPPPACL